MKVQVPCLALGAALRRCAPFVIKRNTMPVLASVLVRARDGQITVAATDMENMVEVAVAGTILEAGQCLVPFAPVAPVIDRLPDGPVIIASAEEADGWVTSLERGPWSSRVAAHEAVDFPVMIPRHVKEKPDDADNAGHTFVMDASQLREMFDAVHLSMSTEGTRYYLQGVLLQHVGDSLRAVSTDGHRLAFIDLPLPDGAEGLDGAIVHRSMVTYLRSVLPQVPPTATVIIWRIGNYIRFTLPDARPDLVLTGKMIDGTYPSYQAVMPAPAPADMAGHMMVHDGAVLLEIIDAMIAGSSERASPAAIEMDDQGLLLRMQARDPVTVATMRIPSGVATWDGRPPFFHSFYQLRYLRDLCVAGGRRFTFQPGLAELSPALMQAGRVTGVVMAMRRDA